MFLISRFSLSRDVLQSTLEGDARIKIVATAETSRECAAQLGHVQPDVVVVDGVEFVRQDLEPLAIAGRIMSGIRVLAIAARPGEEACLDAVRMGVSGYLPASVEPEYLRRAVHAVQMGETVVPEHLMRALLTHLAQRPRPVKETVTLTARERDVLRRLAEGLTDKQIAARLLVAPGTVRIHLRSVYRKLGIRTRAQAAVYAATNGLDDGAVGAQPLEAVPHRT
ncbi:MAG TPA: response regulator transcription factor [bacterium]|nr:response regulator transcription factor [bacterium]